MSMDNKFLIEFRDSQIFIDIPAKQYLDTPPLETILSYLEIDHTKLKANLDSFKPTHIYIWHDIIQQIVDKSIMNFMPVIFPLSEKCSRIILKL